MHPDAWHAHVHCWFETQLSFPTHLSWKLMCRCLPSNQSHGRVISCVTSFLCPIDSCFLSKRMTHSLFVSNRMVYIQWLTSCFFHNCCKALHRAVCQKNTVQCYFSQVQLGNYVKYVKFKSLAISLHKQGKMWSGNGKTCKRMGKLAFPNVNVIGFVFQLICFYIKLKGKPK